MVINMFHKADHGMSEPVCSHKTAPTRRWFNRDCFTVKSQTSANNWSAAIMKPALRLRLIIQWSREALWLFRHDKASWPNLSAIFHPARNNRSFIDMRSSFGCMMKKPRREIITFCTLRLYCFTVKHRKPPFKTSSCANSAKSLIHQLLSRPNALSKFTKHRLAISKLIFAESLFCFFTRHSTNSQRPLLKRRLPMVISRRRWLMSVESRLNWTAIDSMLRK